jgi:hypothetical protein
MREMFFAEPPPFDTVMSFRLYRECDGARELGSKINPIAGAFPIRRLVLSRSGKPMGIGF